MNKIVYSVYLDDIRMPADSYNYTKNPIHNKENWTIVRNYDQFVSKLEQVAAEGATLGSVSLDHDLCSDHMEVPFEVWNDYTADQLGLEMTGLDCAKYLTDFIDRNNMPTPGIICHSMNPVGKKRIEEHISDWMDGILKEDVEFDEFALKDESDAE